MFSESRMEIFMGYLRDIEGCYVSNKCMKHKIVVFSGLYLCTRQETP